VVRAEAAILQIPGLLPCHVHTEILPNLIVETDTQAVVHLQVINKTDQQEEQEEAEGVHVPDAPAEATLTKINYYNNGF